MVTYLVTDQKVEKVFVSIDLTVNNTDRVTINGYLL